MKIIRVKFCNECPYCKNYYTQNLKIYEGTCCTHKENKPGKKIYLGEWEERQKIHKDCPLDND